MSEFKYYTQEHVDALKQGAQDKDVKDHEDDLDAETQAIPTDDSLERIGVLDPTERNRIDSSVSELESLVGNMLKGDLLKKLQGGEYSLIIGDDTSGRIPTLIFGRIASKMAKDAQKRAPRIRFVAGIKSLPDENSHTSEFKQYQKKLYELTDYFGEITSDGNLEEGRVLIVTDTIDRGNTMMGFVSALKANGISPDIVTLALFRASPINKKTADSYKRIKEEQLNGCNIYYSVAGDTPKIYRKPLVTGIMKNPRDLHATTLKAPLSNVVPDLKNIASANNIKRSRYVAYARAKALLIADELYERSRIGRDKFFTSISNSIKNRLNINK